MNTDLQETYVSIGEKIRQLRQRAGLTQTDLVADEYSIAYLSRIEHGYLAPSESFLEHIALRLGLTVADLKVGIYPLKSRAKQKNQEVELLRIYNTALTGDYGSAKSALENMDKTELTSELLARYYFISALIAVNGESYEIAQSNLRQALDIFDSFPALPAVQLGWLHFWLGRVYFLQKRYIPALEHHRQVRQLFSDNKISESEVTLKACVTDSMVLEFVFTDNYDQALIVFKQASRRQTVELDRNKAETLRSSAAQQAQNGNLSPAKSNYLQAAAVYEAIFEAHLSLVAHEVLGEEAIKKSDLNTAENLFNLALATAQTLTYKPALVNLYCHLSEVRLLQKENNRAEDYVQTAREVAGKDTKTVLNAQVQLQSAKVKFAQKDYDNSFELVKNAIAIFEGIGYTNNQLERAYYFFATALQEVGNLAEAIKMYRKALELKK
jgi:tetratricopeptide (TPR) repeat protein